MIQVTLLVNLLGRYEPDSLFVKFTILPLILCVCWCVYESISLQAHIINMGTLRLNAAPYNCKRGTVCSLSWHSVPVDALSSAWKKDKQTHPVSVHRQATK